MVCTDCSSDVNNHTLYLDMVQLHNHQHNCRCSAAGVPWHKASLPPPPPPWRHGTARHKTGRHTKIPTPPPPYSYPARPYPERALRDDHYGVPVTYIWA